MSDMYEEVMAFHKKFNLCRPDHPEHVSSEEMKVRFDLMDEELEELKGAMMHRDMLGIADGIADLIYVVVGTAVSCGIDIRPILRIVHMANMKKAPNPEGGKILKPEGWVAPEGKIAAELLDQSGYDWRDN